MVERLMAVLDGRPSGDHSGPMLWPVQGDASEQIAMRQLRHHTKNALQRLVYQVTKCAGLQQDAAGRALAQELERRIRLSADLSDALFGMTRAPGPLALRLDGMARAAVDLMSDGDQMISVNVAVEDGVPAVLDDVMIRVAHELVGNAVKHGMHVRMVGSIVVRVRVGIENVVLTVTDDGWGLGEACTERGEGLRIAHLLAAQHGGQLRMFRERGRTVSEMVLPCGLD